MFSKFFIERPIFSTVTSLLIVIAGFVSIFNLPIEQYPDLVPPTIMVQAQYPGASSEVVAETVASVLEEKINGVEHMIYMNSVSSSDGRVVVTVTFDVGTNPDQALINVNNRVQMATPLLPEDVRRYGVTVQKRSPSILQVGAFYTTNPMYDETFIGNYANINIVDHIKRIDGVGNAEVLSQNNYSIRVWLKPDKLYRYSLTPSDVFAAISAQNAQRTGGKIGQPPMHDVHVSKNYTIVLKGRYKTEEEFSNIILRANKDGTTLRLKDVADIELGSQTYEVKGITSGNPTAPIMISLSPGANSLKTVDLVNKKIQELSTRFPEGTGFKVVFDTTKFVKHSINEVIHTLIEAFVLVFLIVLLFLKNFRTTLIPCLAVPVSIIGTFAGMFVFGFSINTLTLFALVLAIGIVVDDAIIVIENVDRIHKTEGLSIKDATIKAMSEVTGPVIAIVLVLCAVFVPVSFMGGLSGVMYKQFALTIVISVIISGFVALTLTPALCVVLLSNITARSNKFFDAFDRIFQKIADFYLKIVKILTCNAKLSVPLFSFVVLGTYLLFKIAPTSLVPNEDQGAVMAAAIMDPSASLERAQNVGSIIEKNLLKNKATENTMYVAGYDLLSGAPKNNSVTLFSQLKPWEQRRSPELSAENVKNYLMKACATITDALVIGILPPPIVGMSTTGGFECYLQQLCEPDPDKLEKKTREFVQKASMRPELSGVRSTYNASTPQIKVDVDDVKAMSMGINISDIYSTIGSTFGSAYVNDFSKSGRNFKVLLQAKDTFRAHPDQFNEIYVKSRTTGTMIPISTFIKTEQVVDPDIFERFNSFFSAKIMGNPAPGYTSGQAIKAMEEVCEEVCGHDYHVAWIGSAYQEKIASSSILPLLLFAIIVVFLILAAQYEMWSLPFSVLLSIPFAALMAIIFTLLRGYSMDLYFQIALITLIGLSTKNAILIIEFAMLQHKEKGMDMIESAISAAKLRFRPIIMTSLAFILGCLPLMISSGAGAASRHSLGTSIVGGMIGSTFLATLFIPFFFVIVLNIKEKISNKLRKI